MNTTETASTVATALGEALVEICAITNDERIRRIALDAIDKAVSILEATNAE